jgi:hypothetical protein
LVYESSKYIKIQLQKLSKELKFNQNEKESEFIVRTVGSNPFIWVKFNFL